MKKILSTKELEKQITNDIIEKIPEARTEIFDLIRFCDVSANKLNFPGLYLFSRFGTYYIVDADDKGNTASKIETDDLRVVLWHALNPIIFNISCDYELKHREKKRGINRLISKLKKEKYDSRRVIFAKEIELYGLFGDDFKARRQREIEEILQNNPYVD